MTHADFYRLEIDEVMKKLLQIYSFGARGTPEFPVEIFPLPQLPKNNHVSELQQLILCAVSAQIDRELFLFF